MKCKDIAEFLNERALAELTAAEMAELEAHVSRCTECADQCLASEHLTSFRSKVPPMPASLRRRARELDEVCDSAAGTQNLRRPVIIGSLLLLGAAATMFASVPWRDTSTVNQ